MQSGGFSLINKTRGKVPRVFAVKTLTDMKDHVLGREYELSTALLQPAVMRRASVQSGHGDTPANVLSFPFSATSGEILLCPATIRIQAKTYGKTPPEFLIHLFIHALCHLKGYAHGSIMEHEEQQIAKRFKV